MDTAALTATPPGTYTQQRAEDSVYNVSSLITDTAQSGASYLSPFSKKQHSFLWMFSLVQDVKAHCWKEGEGERCFEGRTALIARV